MMQRRITLFVLVMSLAAFAGLGVAGEDEVLPTVIINEIEINPPGFDSNAEWVELLNVGAEPVDLDGWGLTYDYPAASVARIEGRTMLQPGNRYVFVYPGLRLRNADPKVVELLDPSGAVIDATGTFTDTYDDDSTWQRFPDGGDPLFPDLWIFGPATRAKTND